MTEPTGATLLLVEDRPTDADIITQMLVEHRSDFSDREQEHAVEIGSIEHVDSLAAGIDRVTDGGVDIVLLDLGLPDSDGLETVSAMLEHTSTVPVVVLTGQKGMGVDAIQHGAQDYIVKGRLSPDVLVRTITYALERSRIINDLHDRNHRLSLVNEILRTDLRNDVSMIVGWGDQLRDRVAPDERDAVDAVLNASQHALELTDTAAELMDVLSEDRRIEPQPCNLRSILTPELEQFRQTTDVDLSVDWHAASDKTVSVLGTPMLGSVFKHLLTNATTHNDRKRPEVTVTVSVTDSEVTVSIADDGVGLSADQKKRLADSTGTGTKRTGVGAGLYFVLTVLESIDGELSIEDNHPRGSIATVSLERAGRS